MLASELLELEGGMCAEASAWEDAPATPIAVYPDSSGLATA